MSTMHSSDFSEPIKALTLDDLPVCKLNSSQNNAMLTWCSRRIFSIGGVDLQFEPVSDVNSLSPSTLWMQLDFAGSSCVLALSAAWAAALIQQDGWTLDAMDDLSLDMWCRVRWASHFPTGLILTQSCFNVESLGPMALEGKTPLAWIGHHASSQELSGHELHLWTPDHFPVQALAELVGQQAKAVLTSPLSGLPITLPMIAARWCVDAEDLMDLAVGDLLLIG